MMAMTTSSSIRVKPRLRDMQLLHMRPSEQPPTRAAWQTPRG
jgi:hypothetical protein